jgi:hypothetical protein
MVFPVPIFMKLKITEQHHMEIVYTEIHPNRSLNTEITRTNTFKLFNKERLSLHRFQLDSGFHDNLLNELLQVSWKSDKQFRDRYEVTNRRTHGRACLPYKALYLKISSPCSAREIYFRQTRFAYLT